MKVHAHCLQNVRWANVWLFATIIFALSACVSTPVIEDIPASASIDPIPQPDWSAGMKHEMIDVINGQSTGYEIRELLPNEKYRGASLNTSDNETCTWTGSTWWFAPVDSWENCGSGEWASGTNKVKLLSGGILWPLTPGKKVVYRKSPVSSVGNTGTPETRKCEVVGPVAVNISLGDFDAMKVQCITRRWDNAIETRVWYWTAEHGEIKHVRIHSTEGVKRETELASVAD